MRGDGLGDAAWERLRSRGERGGRQAAAGVQHLHTEDAALSVIIEDDASETTSLSSTFSVEKRI